MTDNVERKNKVISAFKGFMNTYKLEMATERNDEIEMEYKDSWRFFTIDSKPFNLFYKARAYQILNKSIEDLFPMQTDHKLVLNLLLDITTRWIEQENDLQNQSLLESTATEFISQVSEEISPRLMYLPVEGVEIDIRDGLVLGNCKLFSNSDESELRLIIAQSQKRGGSNDSDSLVDRFSSFITCTIHGHPKRATQIGIEQAGLSLNILRLYLASHYFHENRRSLVRRIGLAGQLHLDEQTRVYHVNPYLLLHEQYPGVQNTRIAHEKFKINYEIAKFMHQNGLDRVNDLCKELLMDNNTSDLARRLLRAITWYGKATSAQSVAESYLMCAIAIEGLLSENRTSQETYAIKMSALITSTNPDSHLAPFGGYLSKDFVNKLKSAQNISEKFNFIRERLLELFGYRNRIAHGAVLEQEVDSANLLDFETMVQNTIIAFVKGEWPSLKDFNNWIKSCVSYQYMPPMT